MVTFWQSDQLTINQGLQDCSIESNRPWAVSVANQLTEGETTPSTPETTMWQLGVDGGADQEITAPLVGAPIISGTNIIQQIDGTALTVGRIYVIVFEHGSANNRRATNLPLRAVR